MCSILVCWPKDVYYPWFVQRINKDRDLFQRVVVVMTQGSDDRDYTGHIVRDIDRVSVIDRFVDDGKDWRNAALNRGLMAVGGDVLFLEQDFLFGDGFLQRIVETGPQYRAMGFMDGNRLHPACLYVRRPTLDLTTKDFSVDPDVGDHFSKFTKELFALGNVVDLPNLPQTHLAGLTQNYRLTENWYQPESFYEYNLRCLDLPQPTTWKEVCNQKIKEMGVVTFRNYLEEYFKCVPTS